MYTCSMDLQDCIPADLSPEAKQSHLFSRIFIRQNMCCSTQIEIPYFSSECFDVICSYCGSSDDLLPANETLGMNPLCSTCKSDPKNLVFLSASENLLLDLVSNFYCLQFVIQLVISAVCSLLCSHDPLCAMFFHCQLCFCKLTFPSKNYSAK